MRKMIVGVQAASEKAHSGHDRDDGVIADPLAAAGISASLALASDWSGFDTSNLPSGSTTPSRPPK